MLNLVANGPSGYTISNSVRLRSSASAYLSRTPSVAGTRTKGTISFWVKRGASTSATGQQTMFSAGDGGVTNFAAVSFDTTNYDLNWYFKNVTGQLVTNQVFRDYSAWYHIVLAWDTTQATAANRMLMYVNGVQVTSFSTATYPAQNSTPVYFNNIVHTIGTQYYNSSYSGVYFDGYMTEINGIDGQALTPSSFGSTNATTGVWQPAKYTGTYGTNGFYLNFSNIALTSGSNTGLGKDYSGNGNYWNTNNISVTSGTTYDAMTDVPTLTSATVANYAVMNPLYADPSYSGAVTFSEANLKTVSSTGLPFATIGVSSGKWYWELTVNTITANTNNNIAISTSPFNGANYRAYAPTGEYYNGSAYSAYGATYTTNDIIGVALDMDNQTLTFYKNGVSQGQKTSIGLSGLLMFPTAYQATTNCSFTWNFGQRPFAYTPPTGYVALNTYNLPTSTIVQGNTVMDATLYTGNLTGQSITNTASFKPDLVWIKSRSAATDHKLTDSVRGVTKALISDTTGAETTDLTGLTAFNTNGFTVGASTVYNNTSATYVAWQWQAGQGSTSSNTNGSITSTVSVNASAGFSVVTYTGTGSSATVGHGLGVAPKFIIYKSRSNAQNWLVNIGLITGTQGDYVYLNTTNAKLNNANILNPTSSVFGLVASPENNQSGITFVAYCWAEISGFSKFGSYTGNGSVDGPFIYTGFRPKYVMTKLTSAVGSDWAIKDTSRNTYNASSNTLLADLIDAEYTSNGDIDILSNGFKIRTTNSNQNTSSATYIYIAFAENPFKNALAR